MTRVAKKAPKTPLPASDWSELNKSKAKTPVEYDEERQKLFKSQFRSETRRVKRIEKRETEKVCYNCRKPGHRMADCTQASQKGETSSGICFKCGAYDHSISTCHVKVPEGKLPFATCFVCGLIGHISRDCPKNEKGLYPNGGGCKLCGSTKHLSFNCSNKSNKRKAKDEGPALATLMDMKANVEDEVYEKPQLAKPPAAKKAKKVVCF